jgi:hypothetical protein
MRFTIRPVTVFFGLLSLFALAGILASPTIPPEIDLPGTQPGEVAAFSSGCGCHYGTDNPQWEPGFGWEGSMMGNASRDPIFWATLAIAEQDFVPNADPTLRGGVGDLCIRCHSVGGWMAGNSTPTDGSGLGADEDRGVECEFCHLMVDPDEPTNITGTVEEQNPPFEAFDPVSGEPYFGSGEYVLNSEGTRLGPYAEGDHAANHAAYGSPFHRQSKFCGTCHDVSNSAVGDLAHNFGAMEVMLEPGTYSGVFGSAAETKAAFNNPPYAYGIVERTFSEHVSSTISTTLVNDFPSLPADLRHIGGALDVAYHRAWDARLDANYEDGTLRYFTCQTCHMYARTGKGCDKNNAPIRTDLPQHDHMGTGYWMPDVIQYQDAKGTLVFGAGLTADQITAMDDAKQRAADQLTRAASLTLSQVGNHLHIRVTNLTGHKFITGYPEGRRVFMNVKWLDGGGQEIPGTEIGAYGPIGRTITDLNSVIHQVESIIDLDDTLIYEAEPGMDQQWAAQLSSLGYPDGMVLTYDRMTDAVEHTLGELKNSPAGTMFHTFHFALNNVMVHDNRIPPYQMRYDDARTRNCLPIPKDQFGAPGPGGVYDHWDDVDYDIPSGAVTAEVRLYYQQTSWEYVQFLWLENDTLGPFLGQEGINFLDAWANTGMNAPLEMAFASIPVTVAAGVPGEASDQENPAEQMIVTAYDKGTGAIDIGYTPACDAADHNIYYGDLANVASYGYSDAECSVGVSGAAGFTPALDNVFFLIVGNDGTEEGTYGEDSSDVQRPEDVGTPVCDRVQNLGGVICE